MVHMYITFDVLLTGNEVQCLQLVQNKQLPHPVVFLCLIFVL